jgi:dienelactone hydrolase
MGLAPALLAAAWGCGSAPNAPEPIIELTPGEGTAGEGTPDEGTPAPESPLAGSGADTLMPGAAPTQTDNDDNPVPSVVRGPEPTAESASQAGPFDVQSYSSGLRDGPDYGSQTLYYPSDAEPPFAGVVVVPGFVSPESAIQAWGPFLASHGIVTLTIGTNSGGDSPEERAAALMDAIETVKAEHTRDGSPLQGKVDVDRFAIMGWSMGGGGTLIAASAHPELKAAVGLAAWSPGVTFPEDRVPTLLFAGTADTLAGGQSQGFYSSIPESTPKMLYEVAGGRHSVANEPTGADGEVGIFGLSWLKVFLEGDERYHPLLLSPPSQEADFFSNLQEL